MRRLPLPRNTAGQMALLIAAALFVAQGINLALALRNVAAFRLAQATRPAAVRIADAIERADRGRGPILADRGRVRLSAGDPIPPALERHAEVEQEMRAQLAEVGVKVTRIDTGLRRAGADRALGLPGQRPGKALRRHGDERETLLISAEVPGRGWLTVVSPWPRSDWRILFGLIVQTLILYAIILLPVLWITRRISRPLRALASAARGFDPGVSAAPLVLEGPADVRAVIAAYNALGLRVTAMLDEKDKMLGAIGHDLRTPLAALRVRVESVEDDTDRARMAETIADMNRTLDDILSLARLGRPSEPLVETDLAALVDAVVEDFRDLAADVTFAEADRLPIRLRPSLMRRAIRNLIENAIKYGRCAEVSIANEAEHIAIHVADRGPGIPDHQITSVFDAFTRLETSRNRDTGGIGLGLALARAIVREAGGDIILANRVEGGLIATIWLPRRR